MSDCDANPTVKTEASVLLRYEELDNLWETLTLNYDWYTPQVIALREKLLAAMNHLEKEFDSGEKTFESKQSVF